MKEYNKKKVKSKFREVSVEDAREMMKDEFWREQLRSEYGITEETFCGLSIGDNIEISGLSFIVVSLDRFGFPEWIMHKVLTPGVSWRSAILTGSETIPGEEDFKKFGPNILDAMIKSGNVSSEHITGMKFVVVSGETILDNDGKLLGKIYSILENKIDTVLIEKASESLYYCGFWKFEEDGTIIKHVGL